MRPILMNGKEFDGDCNLLKQSAIQLSRELIVQATLDRSLSDVSCDKRVKDEELDAAISELFDLVRNGRVESCVEYTSQLLQRGMTLKGLYLDILSPIAERLGQLWEDDYLNFGDVTYMVGTLQAILRVTSEAVPFVNARHDTNRKVLLCRALGEDHTFGLLILERFFNEAGWCVSGGFNIEAGPELIHLVEKEYYYLLGISVGSVTKLDAVRRQIEDVRKRSKNRDISVMLGGPVFSDGSRDAEAFGGDLSAVNAELAIEAAESLFIDSGAQGIVNGI